MATQPRTDLSKFSNDWYRPGPGWKRALWFLVNALFFRSPLWPFSGLKCQILRLFGARIGKRVVIKPSVNIKYPWKLRIGDNSWIGEGVWIDNLGEVSIGANVCLSQGAMLLCGNHDYTAEGFDLIVGDIHIEDGAWIGAQALVAPGVKVETHAVLSVKSVASKDLSAWGIYRGNPAEKIRERTIKR